jgi:hypothetical protein
MFFQMFKHSQHRHDSQIIVKERQNAFKCGTDGFILPIFNAEAVKSMPNILS